MTKLDSSMRLKVKRDTFFYPDPKGSVYFRNNVGSFRMEGNGIDQWIEILLPVFDGEHTLGELTEDLPAEYQERVYDIAASLFQNGFVQDMSQERPHQLADKILQKYAPQIEFLRNVADSGAYRFMSYRQANVLAIGSGPIFVSLVAALLDSGLPKLHMLITDSIPTNRQRIEELAAHARKTDPEVAIVELGQQRDEKISWREAVQPFDSILYVSQDGHVEELRQLNAICREEGKLLFPAICLQQVGMAGPLVHPDSEGCWESAWRRVHQSAIRNEHELHVYSSTAGAMLANVTVFEWFKTITGVNEKEARNKVFLLDLETLEGNWHSFLPHPLVQGNMTMERIQDQERHLEQNEERSESNGLIPYFSTLTSAETGIFHIWEEGDLKQLPLAQCRIQAVDPLSEGPAGLLPEMVCTGLTHEEARREAGLEGIEAYAMRMVQGTGPDDFIGVGAGETKAEGVCRGLLRCLSNELAKNQKVEIPSVFPMQVSEVEDARCQYYLQALTTMQGAPKIGLGEEVLGFPVVWVGSGGRWYGSAGLHVTLALRKSLQQALLHAQNEGESPAPHVRQASSVLLAEKEPQCLVIPSLDDASCHQDVLQSALQVLKSHRKQLILFDLALESFQKEELAGVYGVLLREEGGW
ncbi:putative thiazole-containing bacteriocin maturation protein [Brevibacillus panacihumi]|uniref:Putative thiazole-containing bacteriocin maturation protein n=1 Tax=Brevibacillus panacihumi TaxID=497735 RepID=A0A3M8CPA4_9BACL|nr:putative thiazole-containing bacteriocin maturation protein [Brevibacillus panacihumi]RNB77498.1 putative thiazole-containing bacteriocin maturation protein [Brevibacillus panacihumi]